MPKTTKAKGDAKRYPLNMRTTRETREHLESAAAASGRSLAQEVEFRLERSFDQSDLVSRVDDLQHGREVVGFLMLAETAMTDAGNSALGDQGKYGQSWLRDPYAFDQAVKAFLEVAEAVRPAGEIPQPGHIVDQNVRSWKTGEVKVARTSLSGTLGELHAAALIFAVADPARHPGLAGWASAVRERLGDVAEHIARGIRRPANNAAPARREDKKR